MSGLAAGADRTVRQDAVASETRVAASARRDRSGVPAASPHNTEGTNVKGPTHLYLDAPTEGTFRVIVGRRGGHYRFEFDTLRDAVDWIVRNEDSDEHYIAYLEGPDGLVLYDHRNPFAGWVPPLEVVP